MNKTKQRQSLDLNRVKVVTVRQVPKAGLAGVAAPDWAFALWEATGGSEQEMMTWLCLSGIPLAAVQKKYTVGQEWDPGDLLRR